MESIRTRPDLSELLAGKEELVFEKLGREGLLAVNEEWADDIMLGSITMHHSHAQLAERLSLLVINSALIVYKLCEVMLETGLTHSKRAFSTPEVTQDQVIPKRRN